ncbi:glycosyltransferase [Sphingomonas jeddahensis]|uniref:4-alpha-N-acetylgalactosaminyltransferase n=1 Tax=Sphingomonas jeddahensis TaxID=1915074 RepID=A0A1V2EV80_9SPHN|nr:glycosyltransferase [Sphingomonas jeddahensis]ONF96453.1 4-alpha-N-acetylgalactosaminyltransferase [Sphingomonas jeddahensis]
MNHAEHILSYAQTLRGGGVERALLRLAGDWVTAGRRVTLVIGVPDGPLASELPAGVEVVTLGSPDYRALLALPRHVARLAPDVIFCPGNHYTGVAAWMRWRLGRACPPIVGKISNALDRPDHGRLIGAAHAAWLRTHPRFLDRVVAMTPASATATARAMRLPLADVTVIPNPPARPIPDAPTLPLPPRYILGVGRLAAQKRWDRLVAAMPRLRQRVPLVILGEGEARGSLEQQARTLGVEVLMPGHAADPLGAMTRAAVLGLTSDFEGVPGVLREALSVGTPVISTDSSPAVAEIVTDPALGTIVPREDPAALVAALDHWLADAPRPAPVPPPGVDAAARYLALFDSLMPA